MGQYSTESVQKRTMFVRYLYKNTQYPTQFERFELPIAAYGRDGVIVEANKYFREISGITEDDLQQGAKNIFDYLNRESHVLIEAAYHVFNGGGEKAYEDVGRVICAEPGTIAYFQLGRLPNAIFFPLSVDKDGVKLGAVLLDEKRADNDTEDST